LHKIRSFTRIEPGMALAVAILGLLLVAIVLLETFEVMLLPRRVPRRVRMVRVFFRVTWHLWTKSAALRKPARRQDHLALYGPLSMVMLLIGWGIGLVLGFGLVQWGVQAGLPNSPSFWSQLYNSGVVFLTLGFGDAAPQGPLEKTITVVEAATGPGFIAVVIGYLPVLYELYASREIHIMQLEARAGTPPSALELVCRHAEPEARPELAMLLRDWETWCSELLVSHLSYPMLSYYRSQRDNQSWLSGLTAVTDACAIIMVGIEGLETFDARMTFAMARLAAVEMSRVFEVRPRKGGDRLPTAKYEVLVARLGAVGLTWKDPEHAKTKLAALRDSYEPFLEVLSRYLLMPLPSWISYEHAGQEGDADQLPLFLDSRHADGRLPQ
jgi:hypothetical protein